MSNRKFFVIAIVLSAILVVGCGSVMVNTTLTDESMSYSRHGQMNREDSALVFGNNEILQEQRLAETEKTRAEAKKTEAEAKILESYAESLKNGNQSLLRRGIIINASQYVVETEVLSQTIRLSPKEYRIVFLPAGETHFLIQRYKKNGEPYRRPQNYKLDIVVGGKKYNFAQDPLPVDWWLRIDY